MYRILMSGVLLALLAAAPATADRHHASLNSRATISHGNASRLLFKADGIGALGTVAISRARIEFDMAGDTADRVLYLRLCPVTTSWNAASVHWNNGWRRAGGDFDEDLAAEMGVDLSREGGKVVLDVTAILKEWLEGGAEFDGFLLSVQPREGGEGIRGEDVARFQSLGSGSLIVDYRNAAAPPPMARRRG